MSPRASNLLKKQTSKYEQSDSSKLHRGTREGVVGDVTVGGLTLTVYPNVEGYDEPEAGRLNGGLPDRQKKEGRKM